MASPDIITTDRTLIEGNSNASSVAVTTPAGEGAGEKLVCIIGGASLGTIVKPSAWTERERHDSGAVCLAVYDIDGTGSLDSSYTWSWDNSKKHFAVMYRLDGDAEYDVSDITPFLSNDETPDSPSITPTGATRRVIWVIVSANSSITFDARPDDDVDDGSPNNPQGCVFAVNETEHGATATGTQEWDLSNATKSICLSIAYKPGAAAAPLFPEQLQHGHTAEEPAISHSLVLAPESLQMPSSVDAPAMSHSATLTPEQLQHLQTLSAAELLYSPSILPEPLQHAMAIQEAALGLGITLEPAESNHGHATGEPVLQVALDLLAEQLQHAMTIEEPHIIVSGLLQIYPSSLSHGFLLDSVQIVVATPITPDQLQHGHTVESAGISDQNVTLSPEELQHAMTTEEPSITVQVEIQIFPEALQHKTTSAPATVSTSRALQPEDGVSSHTIEAPALVLLHVVQPEQLQHGHSLESPGMSGALQITPEQILHQSVIGDATMQVALDLTPEQLQHVMTLEEVVITIGIDVVGGAPIFVQGGLRIISIAAEGRTITVAPGRKPETPAAGRSIHISGADRTNNA